MNASASQRTAVTTAMLCAAAVTSQFIAGKAVRDALYLANLDVTSLPAMIVACAVVSIGLVAVTSKGLREVSPAAFVPIAFVVSAMMLLAEWLLLPFAPRAAAILVYLQVSGVGPLLGSGFWLIATERFDPHTAKKRFGQIAGAGTLGGLAGGFVAERVGIVFGVAAMLPVLAAASLYCAWVIRRLAVSYARATAARAVDVAPDLAPESPRPGLRVLHDAPYLRNLAGLVLVGTLSAALLDYLFKAQAVAAFGRSEGLIRFFAFYYSATSLITFALQTSSARFSLERLGLAATTGTPSIAVLVGGIAGLIAPGLPSLVAVRGSETIFRGALFRSAYELFYTPMPPAERRAAKSLIDVGVDRFGDAMGGGVIQLVLILLAPASQYAALLAVAIGCACIALFLARRLNRGYIQTLERSLLNRALELDFSDVEDLTTRTVMMRTIRGRTTGTASQKIGGQSAVRVEAVPSSADPEIAEIMALRSRDRARISAVLRHEEGMPATLVPHVIPLLAWDPVSEDAIYALRKVSEERIGELIDALIDPNQPFAVRRRLARVFSVCVSQRAADGLILGLDDQRFEVRFQCGRSLAAIVSKNPRIRIHDQAIYEVVLREVAVGRPVWESHRLLDGMEEPEEPSFVDQFIKDRTSQGLAHVFTLLSLVQPAEPLQIAYRGLLTGDENLRGTALEYLEGTLPPAIRARLWPFLEDRRAPNRTARPRDEILRDLLRSHPSIQLKLEEVRQQTRRTHSEPWPTA
jgi:ATP:ADP antiporter, AAA family